MDGTPHQAKAAASPALGAYSWDIVVTDVTITFKDNRGEPVIVPNHLVSGHSFLFFFVAPQRLDTTDGLLSVCTGWTCCG